MKYVVITLIYVHLSMASPSGRFTKRGSNQLAVEIHYFLPFKEFLTEANTLCRIESAELKGNVQAPLWS